MATNIVVINGLGKLETQTFERLKENRPMLALNGGQYAFHRCKSSKTTNFSAQSPENSSPMLSQPVGGTPSIGQVGVLRNRAYTQVKGTRHLRHKEPLHIQLAKIIGTNQKAVLTIATSACTAMSPVLQNMSSVCRDKAFSKYLNPPT